jgi:hypothetical protein
MCSMLCWGGTQQQVSDVLHLLVQRGGVLPNHTGSASVIVQQQGALSYLLSSARRTSGQQVRGAPPHTRRWRSGCSTQHRPESHPWRVTLQQHAALLLSCMTLSWHQTIASHHLSCGA